MQATPTGAFNTAGMRFNVTIPESTRTTAVRVYLGNFNYATVKAPFKAQLLSASGSVLGLFNAHALSLLSFVQGLNLALCWQLFKSNWPYCLLLM